MKRCPHCGNDVPEGDFCAQCGARLPGGNHRFDPARSSAFVTHPYEPVMHLSIITTLFPHLDRQRSRQAQWLLLAGVLVVLLFGLGRFIPLAIVFAALLLPVLYLTYFVLTDIYDDAPRRVLGATFVTSLILGAVLSLMVARIILSQRLLGFGIRPGYVLLTGIVVPLIAQVLMLVGPLFLYLRMPHFDEPLDGFVFGAAAGFGFATAQSVIYSWLLIVGPFHQTALSLAGIAHLIWTVLFVPLLDAASTGLICVALWLSRDPPQVTHREELLGQWKVAIPIALLGQIVPSLGVDLVGNQTLALVWYGVATAIMLVLLRVQVHYVVLAHARAHGTVTMAICPHCQHAVAEGAFCAHCGLALHSATRRERQAGGTASAEEQQ